MSALRLLTVTEQPVVRIAILDLYMGYPNQGMQAFQEILIRYGAHNHITIAFEIFDVRSKNEIPGTDFDIYLSSGGPGSPLTEENADWEYPYFHLFDQLEAHNLSPHPQKKYAFFVCHSFQLMCRKYQLGKINERHSTSFGVFEMYPTPAGKVEPVFQGLNDPFYAIDSRNWQVTQPDSEQFKSMGATLLAMEKPDQDINQESCMMAIRFSPYFFGTQFHPEADPVGLKLHLLTNEKRQQVIADFGQQKYELMLNGLDNPEKIFLTQSTIIPNFLNEAILDLKEA